MEIEWDREWGWRLERKKWVVAEVRLVGLGEMSMKSSILRSTGGKQKMFSNSFSHQLVVNPCLASSRIFFVYLRIDKKNPWISDASNLADDIL